jgi:hypothetical protein
MPQNGYDSIDGSSSSSKTSLLLKIAGVVVALLVLGKILGGGGSAEPVEEVVVELTDVWPAALITGPNDFNHPTTTAEAAGLGWTKAEGEACNPKLGEAYRKNGGVRSTSDPVTLYFTPAVGGVPGVVSAVEVDYYGYVEDELMGSYLLNKQTTADGEMMHSLAVALRDFDKHDLCDTSAPISDTGMERVTIAPDGAADNVPLHETDEELIANWAEGSCIKTMGVHWGKDTVTGSNMSYEAGKTVPIVPMYGTKDGKLQAFFFYASGRKQTFPMQCAQYLANFFDHTEVNECGAGLINTWDNTPGLTQANVPGFYACSNFCAADCQFSGSPDGVFSTMHWMLKNLTIASPDFEDCDDGKLVPLNPVISCRPDAGPGQGI